MTSDRETNDTYLTKLQFEYGWRWFEFHAKQRMSMFNYFLIITGILANALVASYEGGHTAIAVAIAALGILASVAFICFDIRNRSMAEEGENVLEKLEADTIFGDRLTDESGESLGPLLVERRQGMRRGEKRRFRQAVLKHKVWINMLQGAIALCFALAVVLVLTKPVGHSESNVANNRGILKTDNDVPPDVSK